ncbi:UNVERIFIED_CONTAM: hypothetical protein FKN15_019748 [Acipenser sinensis]
MAHTVFSFITLNELRDNPVSLLQRTNQPDSRACSWGESKEPIQWGLCSDSHRSPKPRFTQYDVFNREKQRHVHVPIELRFLTVDRGIASYTHFTRYLVADCAYFHCRIVDLIRENHGGLKRGGDRCCLCIVLHRKKKKTRRRSIWTRNWLM